ncbi:hypothetical protein DINM_020007 [Dirofilaria immitis]|nr:hypothetical protein [Dirofilaria immitis]
MFLISVGPLIAQKHGKKQRSFLENSLCVDIDITLSDVCNVYFNILQRYKANNSMRTGRHEQSMLIQAALVCGAIEIEIICFNFLLKFVVKFISEEAEIPINIFINCYVILNAAMLPTVHLIFIKRFRGEIKHAAVKLLSKMNIKRASTVVPTVSVALVKSASNEESDEDHDADDEDHVKEHEGHAIEDDEYITKGEFVESDGNTHALSSGRAATSRNIRIAHPEKTGSVHTINNL